MPYHAEILGKRFGRLVVVKFLKERWDGNRMRRIYRCRCDCGNTIDSIPGRLSSGNTGSCGCLKVALQTTHGESKTKVYAVWRAMRERCGNPSNAQYKNYGARGIRVCERWQNFEAFRDDLGPRPKGGTLERNDVNGNYDPSNCRWATFAEQQNNRRDNRKVTFNGITRTISQWAIELGVPRDRLFHRLKKGWPVAEAFTKEWCRGERRDLRPPRSV